MDDEIIGTADMGGVRMPVPRLGPMTATRSFEGDVAAMYAGEGVGAVRRVRPAATIVDDLLSAVSG